MFHPRIQLCRQVEKGQVLEVLKHGSIFRGRNKSQIKKPRYGQSCVQAKCEPGICITLEVKDKIGIKAK
jgi:hypothetical protein